MPDLGLIAAAAAESRAKKVAREVALAEAARLYQEFPPAAGTDGKAGLDGIEGPQGPQGIPGQDGKDGPPGPKGPKGDKGEEGERGEKGDTGPQGPAGSGGGGSFPRGLSSGLIVSDEATRLNNGTVLGEIDFAGAGVSVAQSGAKAVVTIAGGGASFDTPAIVLGTAAAAGVAATVIRSDSTIVAFDATAPTTQAFGDSAAAGSAAVAARRDHKHAWPALGTTAAAVGTSAGGSAATPSKSDHVHATGAGTPSTQAFGDAAATGSGPAAAMTDHKHAMPANPTVGLVSSINFVIDGGGSAITTGIKGDLVVDFACTINSATLLADQSGSIVVNIWKDTYANFPPVVGDKITASAPPTISSATKSQDATLTGWTTSITAGDTLRFNVDSITTVTRVTIVLKVTRT